MRRSGERIAVSYFNGLVKICENIADVLDANGKAVPGSERNVRIVKKTGLPLLLSIFFLPLVAGAGIVGTRLMKIRNSQC